MASVIQLCKTRDDLLMKEHLIPLIAVCVISITTACTQDLQLAKFIQLTESESKSERVAGYESIGEYWKVSESGPGGFADTPVEESNQRARKGVFSDEQLDSIATAIKRGIEDKDPDVREAAAIALIGAPRSSDSVLAAILTGIKSDDPVVNWYVMQQKTGVWPGIDVTIDHLIDDLSDTDFNKHYPASDLLRHYGEKARPYSKRIAQAVFDGKDNEEDRTLKMYVLCDIGLTKDAAETLVANAAELTKNQAGIVAISLLEYPDELRSLSVQHPNLAHSLGEHSARLFPFLCRHQNKDNPTRIWLASQESLPPNIMGMLGEPRFVKEIEKLEATSNKHHQTFLAACSRACGGKVKSVIEVNSQKPVEFRPASAWPKTDDTRRSKTSFGHGDGYTWVMVTGEILGTDGTHPEIVQFYRSNDSMLLGSKQNYQEPVMYNASTGRFVFLTTVFAAYCTGDDQAEPGPYQTGSAQISIEAPGFNPLVVQFFDEMPDVKISLDKQKKSKLN